MSKKFFSKKISSLLLTMILTVTAFNFASFAQETGVISNSPIEVEVTSAIDGSPFIASYDSETDIVSLLTIDGELKSQRFNYSEEEFEELIETNRTVTEKMNNNEVNESRIINQVPKTPSLPGIRPYFYTELRMNIPKILNQPERGALVGNYLIPNSDDSYLGFWTWELPAQSDNPEFYGIDVYLVNEIGDDYYLEIDVPAHSDIRYEFQYPGEAYGAKVSCFWRSLTNIRLTFYSS